jgi:DMSO reductase family type II enzyme heme b subunit
VAVSTKVIRGGAVAAALSGAALLSLAGFTSRRVRQDASVERGREVYVRWCEGCHGDEGRGDGPAAGRLLPKPRDFVRALYQVRSTATGELPTDADLHRVVDDGMPGTSMPGWAGSLSGRERDAVIAYIKTFNAGFAAGQPTPLRFSGDPGGGRETIDSGRALYRRIECWKCHGDAGRGDGQSAPTLKDDFGNPIRAADLTENWHFNGGGEVEDIYRTLRTGLDGTPMPSFSDLIEGQVITDEDLWRVAHYVRSLSPREPPVVREVVRAALVEGPLPGGPDDSAWAAVEPYYFPLVGQVIVKPRWFSPMVGGVWVQAVHDGSSLAVRVTWHDPSESPDTTWNLWRSRMASRMEHDDTAAAADTSLLPDRLAMQFATRIPTGMDRPYFLMGSANEPVYLWLWESAPRSAVEASARGPERVEPLAASSDSLASWAVWDRGEWRVQLTRSLATADSTDRLQFAAGREIPMALYAWDGSSGEAGTRMAVGSWVSIYLAEPGKAGTVVWPVLAMLSTGGLGLMVVARAQRTARAKNETGTAKPEAV